MKKDIVVITGNNKIIQEAVFKLLSDIGYNTAGARGGATTGAGAFNFGERDSNYWSQFSDKESLDAAYNDSYSKLSYGKRFDLRTESLLNLIEYITESTPFMIGEHKVTFHSTGAVTVGYTNVTNAQMQEIIKRRMVAMSKK